MRLQTVLEVRRCIGFNFFHFLDHHGLALFFVFPLQPADHVTPLANYVEIGIGITGDFGALDFQFQDVLGLSTQHVGTTVENTGPLAGQFLAKARYYKQQHEYSQNKSHHLV